MKSSEILEILTKQEQYSRETYKSPDLTGHLPDLSVEIKRILDEGPSDFVFHDDLSEHPRYNEIIRLINGKIKEVFEENWYGAHAAANAWANEVMRKTFNI